MWDSIESLAVVLLETVFLPTLWASEKRAVRRSTFQRSPPPATKMIVGVHRCGLAEHLDRRVIKADLVVLDRVAVDMTTVSSKSLFLMV